MKEVKAFGFDQSAVRDMGILFLPEVAKTLTNGSSPGHHSAIVQAKNGCWTVGEKMGLTYTHWECANTLTKSDSNQPQVVIYELSREDRTVDVSFSEL